MTEKFVRVDDSKGRIRLIKLSLVDEIEVTESGGIYTITLWGKGCSGDHRWLGEIGGFCSLDGAKAHLHKIGVEWA